MEAFPATIILIVINNDNYNPKPKEPKAKTKNKACTHYFVSRPNRPWPPPGQIYF